MISFDHVVIAVSDWERSNAFYRDVHGPGVNPDPVAADPVRPGNSDLCFRWEGTVEEAISHVERHGVPISSGP